MYVIFLKSSGFRDFKYDTDISDKVVMDMDLVDTKTNKTTRTQ